MANAKQALERRKDDVDAHARLSAVEKGALSQLLRPVVSALDDEHRSVLIDEIDSLPWAEGDAEAVTKLVLPTTKATNVAKKEKKRRGMQDFCNFLEALTAEQWKVLLDEKTSAPAKRKLIIKILVSLGCRCASEHTKSWRCLFGCILQHPPASILLPRSV